MGKPKRALISKPNSTQVFVSITGLVLCDRLNLDVDWALLLLTPTWPHLLTKECQAGYASLFRDSKYLGTYSFGRATLYRIGAQR